MTYFMRGVFEQGIGEHPLVGVLRSDLDDTMVGSVMSSNRVYDVEGVFSRRNGAWCLDFVLEPHGGGLWKGISAHYQLEKSDGTKQVGGRYEGYYEHTKGGFHMLAEGVSRIIRGGKNKVRLTLDAEV